VTDEADLQTTTLTWEKRKGFIKHQWLFPFIWVEWLVETAVFWIKRSALVELVGTIAGLSVILAAWQYVRGADEREKVRQYQAWQVLGLAHGKGGSGGRIAALRDLLSDGVDLSGVDLSKAWLHAAFLANARLTYAKFDSADLRRSDLQGANLAVASGRGAIFYTANLQNAFITGADFQGALMIGAQLCGLHASTTDFRDADFSASNMLGAQLMSSDLRGARMFGLYNWRNIVTLALTNIYGLRDAPEGFEQFAKDSLGAVAFKSRLEWQKFLVDSVAIAPYLIRSQERIKDFAMRRQGDCWDVRQLSDSEPPSSAFSAIPVKPKLDTTHVYPFKGRP